MRQKIRGKIRGTSFGQNCAVTKSLQTLSGTERSIQEHRTSVLLQPCKVVIRARADYPQRKIMITESKALFNAVTVTGPSASVERDSNGRNDKLECEL